MPKSALFFISCIFLACNTPLVGETKSGSAVIDDIVSDSGAILESDTHLTPDDIVSDSSDILESDTPFIPDDSLTNDNELPKSELYCETTDECSFMAVMSVCSQDETVFKKCHFQCIENQCQCEKTTLEDCGFGCDQNKGGCLEPECYDHEDCDDDNMCTVDSCFVDPDSFPSAQCQHVPIHVTMSPYDEDYPCNDGNACTEDYCSHITGECTYQDPCDDVDGCVDTPSPLTGYQYTCIVNCETYAAGTSWGECLLSDSDTLVGSCLQGECVDKCQGPEDCMVLGGDGLSTFCYDEFSFGTYVYWCEGGSCKGGVNQPTDCADGTKCSLGHCVE